MFWKRAVNRLKNRMDNTRPTVTSVSKLIDKKSHKQKKYISLMVVPSYSTGKTRTLRVPRALFHGIIASMLIVSAVVTGVNLRANYFQRMAQDLDQSLVATENRYYQFRAYAEQVQDDLLETASQIYAELSDSEHRAQSALNEQATIHQSELESILEQIENIERIIRELDEDRLSAIEGLGSRAEVIPPIASLFAELEASQEALLALSHIHNPPPVVEPVGVGLMALGTASMAPTTHDTVHEYLALLANELDVQRKLMDSLEHYRGLMNGYLLNFPTLWPVAGQVSSGFGWRSNPFGGGGQHHRGIDIRAPRGTNIHATGGGTVIFDGWSSGYGNTIIIDHGNGIHTLYAHNSRNLVYVGQRVERGDIIGLVGATGLATGPHVHYEVQVNGVAVDPWPFMREHFS